MARGMMMAAVALIMMMVCGGVVTTNAQLAPPTTPLIIYTYDDLFSNTGYDPAAAYAAARGWNSSLVKLYMFDSSDLPYVLQDTNIAKELLISGPDTSPPLPDIVVALDSVTYTQCPDIFDNDFVYTNVSLMDPRIAVTGGDTRFDPFDYGIIGIIYDAQDAPDLANHAANFTLEWLVTSGNVKDLITIDPRTSTTGVAFLMTTVAVFGDAINNITGTADPALGDFRHWWDRAFATDMMIAKSWSDAFTPFSSDETHYTMMVSYGTDPAFNLCYDEPATTLEVLLEVVGGRRTGWAMVEGQAKLANTNQSAIADDFMNWFFSIPPQSEIYLGQFMQPANTLVYPPLCFNNTPGTVLPSNVELFNHRLFDNNSITTYYQTWMDDWTILYNKHHPGSGSRAKPVFVLIAALVTVLVCLF